MGRCAFGHFIAPEDDVDDCVGCAAEGDTPDPWDLALDQLTDEVSV